MGTLLGTVFGARALQLKADRDDVCPASECASEEGLSLDEEARTMAAASTIAFVAGGAAAAGAVALWIFEPEDQPAVVLVPAGPGASVVGRF